MVERIVTALRASGELGNTLLMFSSDNGFFHGEHRVPNGKVLLYEPSIHLPLLMRGPGIPRGQRRTQLAVSADWAPTILAAARANAVGRVMDGASLWPLIRDRQKELGRDIVLEDGPGAANFKGLRTMHYKYAEYGSGDVELYDLVRDPYELTNVAADSRYSALRAIFATRLARLRECHGAACREGPIARLLVRYRRGRGGCAAGPVSVEVRGTALVSVSVYANGRRRATDSRTPFAVRLALPRGRTFTLRARVSDLGDRLVTLDSKLRTCR